MAEEKRNEYKLLELQSPMVVTTKCQSQDSHDVTMELTFQNFKLTLFTDPGFFKFCYIKVNQLQGESLFIGEGRALDYSSANKFMESRPFTVLDYKLKTLATGSYAGTPMGLFLLEDRQKPGYAVCAHVHFERGNTCRVERINLVHHSWKSPNGILNPYFVEEGRKFEVKPLDGNKNVKDLVKACRDYVEKTEKNRWKDLTQWKMTGFGFSGLFRVHELQKQRSIWEESYLKHIEKFNLTKAASK